MYGLRNIFKDLNIRIFLIESEMKMMFGVFLKNFFGNFFFKNDIFDYSFLPTRKLRITKIRIKMQFDAQTTELE